MTVSILNRDPLIVIRGSGMTEFHGFVRRTVPVRNFTGLPITITGLAEAFAAELDVKAGSVRLEGPQNQLDLFVPPPEFLYVDGSGIAGPGAYTLPVEVSLPEGLNLARQEPQEALLTARSAGDEAP